MFMVQFAPKSHLFWRVLQRSQRTSHALNGVPVLSNYMNAITRHTLSSPYPAVACGIKTFANLCKSDTTMTCDVIRPYQVVVAATREMGIGKDGKLPWDLPSDIRYFKEVTTTSVAGKKNAVVMGRRTWESIPQKYRPLPGRVNVVLTRSGRLELATLQDLLVCSDLPAALRLLAEPPLSTSVEKVFVIGGGQVLKDALNAPGCEAVHLTDIETNIECDTFIPMIDLSLFHQLHSSRQMVENNIRFSFVTYIRKNGSDENSPTSENATKFNVEIETS